MNFVVLLILAVIWAGVLVPPMVRSRVENSPVDSIGAFRRQLSVLQRANPEPLIEPAHRSALPAGRPRRRGMTKRDASRRRRDILTGLMATAGVTLVLGLLPPFRVLLMVHVVTLVLLVGYMALLVRVRKLAEERAHKVRRLPTAAPATEPALARTAAN